MCVSLFTINRTGTHPYYLAKPIMSYQIQIFKIQNYKNEPINNYIDSGSLTKLCNNDIPIDPNAYLKLIETSSYQFSLTLSELVVNSKIRNTKPPRPLNCWIIYSRNKCNELKKFKEYKNTTMIEMKRIVSLMWKKERQEVKSLFIHLEKYAKILHKNIYGENYKYKPKRLINKKSVKVTSI